MQLYKTSTQWESLSELSFRCRVTTKRIRRFWGKVFLVVNVNILYILMILIIVAMFFLWLVSMPQRALCAAVWSSVYWAM